MLKLLLIFRALFYLLMIINFDLIMRPFTFLMLYMLQIDLTLLLRIVSFYYALFAIFANFIYFGVGVRRIEHVLFILLLMP